MTLFKGTEPQSFRHNMASHMYSYVGNSQDFATLLEEQNLLTFANHKHFTYSFKGLRHDYEGVVMVSNLRRIEENQDYYQEPNRLKKEGDFFTGLRRFERKQGDRAGVLSPENTQEAIITVYQVSNFTLKEAEGIRPHLIVR